MVVCIQDWGVYRFMPNLVFLGVLVNSAVLQTRVSLECSLLKTGYAVFGSSWCQRATVLLDSDCQQKWGNKGYATLCGEWYCHIITCGYWPTIVVTQLLRMY